MKQVPQGGPAAASPATTPDRLVDGVPVRTYRGQSLAALAPQIRAELGDHAMILRQREGVSGGFAGFFAKRCVEIDVAVVGLPATPGVRSLPGRLDVVDGPPAGPQALPVVAAAPAAPAAFAVSRPTAAQAAAVEAALARPAEPESSESEPTAVQLTEPEPAPAEPVPDPAAPPKSFEDHLQEAGLADAGTAPAEDPATTLRGLRVVLEQRGLPKQLAMPIIDDTLRHRVALEPGRPAGELLISELARRIPTALLSGCAGQAVAFVGVRGAGKTRAVARLAAAYSAAQVPVACVTLQSAGEDGLLVQALAPFGVAVHTAPDIPRALDRITARRRHALVLIDTAGIEPGDHAAIERLATLLRLLELDHVALCLPATQPAVPARRAMLALRALAPTVLIATHTDAAEHLGGVVAVAIDRRLPIGYLSGGPAGGTITGADAHQLATALVAPSPAVPAAAPAGEAPAAIVQATLLGVAATVDPNPQAQ